MEDYTCSCAWLVPTSIALVLIFGYFGAPLILWTALTAAILHFAQAPIWLWWTLGIIALIFNVKPLRRYTFSAIVLKVMKAFEFIPRISETERTALDAGVVWIEGDLFSGKPNFKNMLKEPYPSLTTEEQAFLDGPVEELCKIIDDWKIWKTREIPQNVMDFLKQKKFFGMIIPKKYGGLEFSALAHSAVITKLGSRSLPVTITTMVPNSLGPAELLNHFGTDAQKNHYLPKLATGEFIPCFALTEPGAGSDAGSIQSDGVVFKKDGKTYIRLNWNKRYITLAAISHLLGLAFRLKDPENILGTGKKDLGITCALIPTETPGVVIGRRHDPLSVPFYNCPTQGKDVVVPIDAIIGGEAMAGKGWMMLMECLSAGRGISLPSQSAGGAFLLTRAVSCHAFVRKQFGVSLGHFEGIEEPLARIVSNTYLLEGMRRFIQGAIDKGIKPPVVTAIAKYHSSEMARRMINDGMDIMGGGAISRGPRNLLAQGYMSAPISVTVEGANILTRTLMIFGQGAMRAHPYAYKEVRSVEMNDLKGFDEAFCGHLGHIVRNSFRSVILSITRARFYCPPRCKGVGRYYQKLAWASASFAIMSDIAMGSLGGALKLKEKITGRYADILSWLFMGFCVLKRYEADGYRKEDKPIVDMCMSVAFCEIQQAFDGIFANLRVPFLTWFFRGVIRPWAKFNSMGSAVTDDLGHKVASLILRDSEQRTRLTHGMFVPKSTTDALGRYENAFRLAHKAAAIEKKMSKAIKAKTLPKKPLLELIEMAVEKNVIDNTEAATIREAELAKWDAVQVDDFSQDEFLGRA